MVEAGLHVARRRRRWRRPPRCCPADTPAGSRGANRIQPYFVRLRDPAARAQVRRAHLHRRLPGLHDARPGRAGARREGGRGDLRGVDQRHAELGSLVSIEPAQRQGAGDGRRRRVRTQHQRSQFNIATERPAPAGLGVQAVRAAGGRSRTASRPDTASSRASSSSTSATTRSGTSTNYTKSYAGSITCARAMTESDNTVYAQLTMTVRARDAVATARTLGITSPLDEGVPAIGLGGLRVGVTPLEMAHAYATIANKGVRIGGSVLFHSADRRSRTRRWTRLDRAHPLPGREGRRQHAEGDARDVRDQRPDADRRDARRRRAGVGHGRAPPPCRAAR